jgi:hypothetical protein
MKGCVYGDCCNQGRLMIVGSVAAFLLIAVLAMTSNFLSPSEEARNEAAATLPCETSIPSASATPESPPSAVEMAPFPHTPIAIAPPPRLLPEATAPELDSNGFVIHSLAKRLDERPSGELERELLRAREVALSGPPALQAPTDPKAPAQNQKAVAKVYVDSILAVAGRPDLAGLPFHFGRDAMLDPKTAKKMDVLSKEFRQIVRSNSKSARDPRPDIKDLHATLIGAKTVGSGKVDPKQWATPESVQCLQQMLQAENGEFRRMTCELLSGIDIPEATEALVKWAVFDTYSVNRAAAVDALRKRDQKEVTRLLARYIRYPWARVVEHAAEALVALNCQEVIPQLIAAYDQPEPSAPFRMELPNQSSGTFRLEVVRVNHARNCVTCHAQSFQVKDLARAAVPNPEQPLPPSLTPAYYSGSNEFVRADVTYLRQDFSVVQPVANPGKWSALQRYDYFVSVVRDSDRLGDVPASYVEYRRAIRFAIVELSQHDPDTDATWLAEQLKTAVNPEDSRLGDVARFLSLEANPGALTSLKALEFVRPLLSANDDDLSAAIQRLQKTYGMAQARLALIAYIDPLTRTGDPGSRSKAARLLTATMSDTPDEFLSTAMKNAVNSPGDTEKK